MLSFGKRNKHQHQTKESGKRMTPGPATINFQSELDLRSNSLDGKLLKPRQAPITNTGLPILNSKSEKKLVQAEIRYRESKLSKQMNQAYNHRYSSSESDGDVIKYPKQVDDEKWLVQTFDDLEHRDSRNSLQQ